MITVIGNGESRKSIKIADLKGFKCGCNGIYLHEKVDLVCAMDKFWRDKIEKENIPLLSRKINNRFQMNLQIHEKGTWKDTNCLYRGYCSGTSLLDYICQNYKDDIYMIGFDFGYTGEKVNHIYKDTQFHPKSTRPAQNENIFLNETLEIIKRYPLHKIYWVNDNDFDIKINRISVNEFKEIAYV